MSDPAIRERLRRTFALPIEEQRAALMPGYEAAYAAWDRRDWAVNTIAMSDDFVFELGGASTLVGIPSLARGVEEYIGIQRQLVEVFPEARVVFEDLHVVGPGRVVVLYGFAFRAAGSQRELTQQSVDLHQYRDGELVHQTYWPRRTEGLEALGMSV